MIDIEKQPPILRSGRNPYEVWLTVGTLLNGAYGLIFTPPSATLNEVLPVASQVIWSVQILVGAILTLVGIYHKDMLYGLKIERIGTILSGIGCFIYVGTLYDVSTFERAGIVMTISALFGIAGWHRALQIRRDLNKLRAWAQAQESTDG